MPRGAKRIPLQQRLERRREITDAGCWIWTGRLMNEGYGVLTLTENRRARPTLVHRVAYELYVGPIPTGLVIDHLCRNRACHNPRHLEAVDQRANTLRSPVALGAINAAKTHCPQGHAYSAENTYVYRPKKRSTTMRICKTCRAEQCRRRRARKNGAAA